MNKTLILIITAVLILCLFAGCGSADIDPGVDAATPVSPSDTESEPAKAEFSRGIVDENAATYINEYAGLRFALPEGWSFASEEELSALVLAGSESVYADEANSMQDILELTTVYDMMAVGDNESITVVYENLKYHIGGISLTETAYAEALAEQLSATQGLSYSVEAPAAAQLAGLDGTVLNASLGDSVLYQSYFIRKIDERMLVIIFTAADAPAWESFKTCFASE